jgi:5-amino-6-(5-phosphoribosylamino)uracil reductase
MWVAASLSQSIDGKLASNLEPSSRMGSQKDLTQMQQRRGDYDAILVGGQTFRAWPIPYTSNKSIHNVVITRSDLSSLIKNTAPWKNKAVTLHVLSPPGEYPKGVCWHPVGNGIPDLLAYLHHLQVNRLLIEGGGSLLAEFQEHCHINEIFLTVCPYLIGGRNSPTLLDGEVLKISKQMKLVSSEAIENEVFLHYQR